VTDRNLAGTIVAVSTAPGLGGIGIVRLSGPASLEIALRLFRPKSLSSKIAAGRAYLGSVADPDDGRPVDEGIQV